MAVSKKKPKEVKGSNLVAAAVAQFEALLREHMAEVLEVLEESESRNVTVNCATKFNLAESEPQVESILRFSQTVTDKRTSVLDDPNQGTFWTAPDKTPAADEAEAKPKKSKKAKKGESEETPADEPAQA